MLHRRQEPAIVASSFLSIRPTGADRGHLRPLVSSPGVPHTVMSVSPGDDVRLFDVVDTFKGTHAPNHGWSVSYRASRNKASQDPTTGLRRRVAPHHQKLRTTVL